MESASSDILIVGGSIVGLSAALALASRGATVTVLERTAGPGFEGGGGLGIDLDLLADVTGRQDAPPVCHGWDRATTAWPLLAGWLEGAARGRALVSEADLPAAARTLPASEPSREFYSGPYRLVTYTVPGAAGETDVGRRRLNVVWYDPARAAFLAESGILVDERVSGSLTADALPQELRTELAGIAEQRWPSPWSEAIEAAAEAGTLFATPIAHYRPDRLIRARVALAGDAAHAASPMVGGGFTQGLYDAAALADAFAVSADPGEFLQHYERARLASARRYAEYSMAASSAYLDRRME
jgi:2-polyprenyl-6-methoxyphenol hydroxylase-like FAD-dependent oxidoreductase